MVTTRLQQTMKSKQVGPRKHKSPPRTPQLGRLNITPKVTPSTPAAKPIISPNMPHIDQPSNPQEGRVPLVSTPQYTTGLPPDFVPQGYTVDLAPSQEEQHFEISQSSQANEQDLDEFIQEPRVVATFDKILSENQDHFFRLLVEQGAKLPQDFDLSSLKETNNTLSAIQAVQTMSTVTTPLPAQGSQYRNPLFQNPIEERAVSPLLTPMEIYNNQQETLQRQAELAKQATLAQSNMQPPRKLSTPIASGILVTPSRIGFPPNYNLGNNYVAMQQGSQQMPPPISSNLHVSQPIRVMQPQPQHSSTLILNQPQPQHSSTLILNQPQPSQITSTYAPPPQRSSSLNFFHTLPSHSTFPTSSFPKLCAAITT